MSEPGAVTTPWAPLRIKVYRALWLAAMVSNIGTWMQTVGAQWLLVDEPNAPTLVALVQTAGTLPVVLLALPSGVLADTFERRRLLLAVQLFQVAVGVAMTAMTAVGRMQPALLLAFTFALGTGAALFAPAYQALIPELVPRQQLVAASALSSASLNLARVVGPAIAGLLVARLGVAAVFALNTLTFLAFAIVLAAWRRKVDPDAAPPERFVPALRAGGRYVRHSPVVRRILLRTVSFVVPASVLWALLALIANRRLDMDAGGYGLLLAALGGGAVAGAFLLPRITAHLSANRLLVAASLVYAGSLVVVVSARDVLVVLVALVPAGLAWVAVLSSINATVQLFLPGWVRARGLSAFQVVQAGGQAAGSLLWGVVAETFGLRTTFLVAAALLATAAVTIPWHPLIDTRDLDRSPASYWPEPELGIEPDRHAGPVLVKTTYTVPPENEDAFLRAMDDVRRSRLRTGATRWDLYREGESPRQLVEVYAVPSWDEHLRQHSGRLTGSDRAAEERATALSEPDPDVAHLFPADRTR